MSPLLKQECELASYSIMAESLMLWYGNGPGLIIVLMSCSGVPF